MNNMSLLSLASVMLITIISNSKLSYAEERTHYPALSSFFEAVADEYSGVNPRGLEKQSDIKVIDNNNGTKVLVVEPIYREEETGSNAMVAASGNKPLYILRQSSRGVDVIRDFVCVEYSVQKTDDGTEIACDYMSGQQNRHHGKYNWDGRELQTAESYWLRNGERVEDADFDKKTKSAKKFKLKGIRR